jgi:hypothetical protein
MTTTHTILFILAALAFTLAFVWVAKRAQTSEKRWVRALFGGGARRKVSENHYAKLREHALNALPYVVGAGTDLPGDHVYGAVVEWPINGAVMTVTAFQNGDSSLYLSTGQMFIGGAGRPSIAAAAKRLVDESQRMGSRAQRTNDVSSPDPSEWSFYLHTPRGRLRHNEPELALQSGASPWSQVFNAAQELITQWRLQEQRDR